MFDGDPEGVRLEGVLYSSEKTKRGSERNASPRRQSINSDPPVSGELTAQRGTWKRRKKHASSRSHGSYFLHGFHCASIG